MARKRKRADHRRDPRRPTIVRRHAEEPGGRAEDQPLLRTINQALYDGHPLALLEQVSAIMTALEPARDPLGGSDESRTTLDEIVASFEATDLTSTTAALHVFAALTRDDELAARIRNTLETRHHRLPGWLARLDETRVEKVVELRHVLRDGEDFLLDVRLPDGFVMTAIIYVDNNLGLVVKDAFMGDRPFRDVVDRFLQEVAPDTSLHQVDPAEARAHLDAALQVEAIMFPPMESDTWPACRPLVRWLVGLLPGGVELPDWEFPSDEQQQALVERFLASSYGAGFDDPDHRSLLQVIVDFGAMYGVGNPLLWSPVSIELLLVDRVPRKVIDRPEVLTKLPRLLRAFVRFAYADLELSAELLAEAMDAVDRWEPDYQRLIRTPRAQGAEALARMMMGEETGLELDLGPDWSFDELVAAVGGEDEPDELDDEPLPDEPFEWFGLPDDLRPKLEEILALCDANADEFLDVEHRTANRRLLRDLARIEPAYFRGRAAARTSAAAIVYMVARANDSVGPRRDVSVGELMAAFGGKHPYDRVGEFRRFLGLTGPSTELGSPDYLTGARRAELIEEHELYADD